MSGQALVHTPRANTVELSLTIEEHIASRHKLMEQVEVGLSAAALPSGSRKAPLPALTAREVGGRAPEPFSLLRSRVQVLRVSCR
jgi:hypothetical protein